MFRKLKTVISIIYNKGVCVVCWCKYKSFLSNRKIIARKFGGLKENLYICRRIIIKNEIDMFSKQNNWWWRSSRFARS